ncbi:M16 family metallopeptidase [Dysgonomonas termitidis]|uniref:M16 family metallopeptidase n=1 Tax=Dysgonomonas termitidis TaxID=1516126 RepID=A0ABV9KQU4_9BACT
MEFYIKHILLGLAIMLFSTSVSGQKLKQNPTLIKGRLDNGLTYYIYPNQTPKGEAVYRLFIKSGSVFEEDSQKGLAHFLEHMAFNGTAHFPDDGIVRFLESKGAKFGKDLNAHTSFNETVYKLQLPSNNPLVVDSTMTILSDWAGRLSLDSLQIEKERGVIMSEWLSKTGPKQDAQNALLYELLNKSRFSDRIVIGDTAVIQNFSHKDIKDYYQQWYNPSLMAVAVVGDINPTEIERMIKEKFGELKTTPKKKKAPTYAIDSYKDMAVKSVIHESLDKVELVAVQLLPTLSPVQSEKEYPAYLERVILNRLFNERMTSLSFNDPSYKKANISVLSFLNTKSILLTSVELTPTKIDDGINTFAREIEQIYRYGFIPLEIEKVKKSYLASLKRNAESERPVPSINLMNEIYSDFYVGNKVVTQEEEYNLAKKYISKIDSTSLTKYLHKTADWSKTHFILSAFDKVAEELPSDDNIKSVFSKISKENIAPYKKTVNIPDQLLASLPKPGSIVDKQYIKEINAHILSLSNGAKVVFKSTDIDKDKITLSGFRKGGLYTLDSLDFVNGLYAKNVIGLSGAGNMSRDELAHYLTGNTAKMLFLIDNSRVGMGGSSNNEDLETQFQLLYLKWMYPRIDTTMYEQIKKNAIESYRTANKVESGKFYEDLSYILQGKDYTNREVSDTILENELKLEALIPIYNHSFGGAKDFTFVIIGDCDLEAVTPYITQYLAALPGGEPSTSYQYKRPARVDQYIVFERNDGESPRAIVNLVFQQNRVDGSLRLENLKNGILKAVIRTKLLKSLREEMGMVYSVSVSAGSAIAPEPLSRQTIGFTTAPENVEKLLDRTLKEIEMMINNPESFDSELADIKMNLIKEMSLDVQKSSFWSSFIRNTIFNNETDWNYVSDYNDIVNSITAKDIASFAESKMYKDRLMVKAVLYPKGYDKTGNKSK